MDGKTKGEFGEKAVKVNENDDEEMRGWKKGLGEDKG